jgi:hypothetical protein
VRKGIVQIERDGVPGILQREPSVRVHGLKPIRPTLPVGHCQDCMCFSIVGVEGDGSLEMPARLLVFFGHHFPIKKPSLDAEVVGFEALRRFPFRQLPNRKLAEKGFDDACDDLVLHREYIRQVAVEPLRPKITSAFACIDQLGVDTNSPRRSSGTPLEDVAYAQLLGDAGYMRRLALEREGGVPGNHEKARCLGQLGDEIVGQSVREEFLFGIRTQVRKGKDGD